jgi:hypothetical protein
MLEITNFRGPSYEKAHRQGSGTATYYRTLINAWENQHPMKYGQLVEKVINSSRLLKTTFRWTILQTALGEDIDARDNYWHMNFGCCREVLHTSMPGRTGFKSASDELRTAPRKGFSVDNARKNQFKKNFIWKAHREGTGTATYYRTLIDARENEHPMKYGQLVEKVANSTIVCLWYSPSHELYGQLLEKVSVSVEIARKKQFQMNWG